MTAGDSLAHRNPAIKLWSDSCVASVQIYATALSELAIVEKYIFRVRVGSTLVSSSGLLLEQTIDI